MSKAQSSAAETSRTRAREGGAVESDLIVVWSKGGEANWFFVAAPSPRPDINGKPVYETLDAIVPAAQLDTLRAQLEAAVDNAVSILAREKAAEAEVARLRKDAFRYKFIRSESTPNIPALNVLALGALDRAVDAAIDAAAARTKEAAP